MTKYKNDSYFDMINCNNWKNDLQELNQYLVSSLKEKNKKIGLNGNLFYAPMDTIFYKNILLPDCEEKRINLFNLAHNYDSNSKQPTTFFEVGVNGGHSMFLVLSSNPNIKCVGIDICEQVSKHYGHTEIYVEKAIQKLQELFPNRVTFIKGDSIKTLPNYSKNPTSEKIDILHLDGAKNNYYQDFLNLEPLLHQDSLIIFDDSNTKHVINAVTQLTKLGKIVLCPEYQVNKNVYKHEIYRYKV